MRTDPRETAETPTVPRRPVFPASRRVGADGGAEPVSLFEFENLVAIGIVLLFGTIVLASGATSTPGTPADGETVVIEAPAGEVPPLQAPTPAPAAGITLATVGASSAGPVVAAP